MALCNYHWLTQKGIRHIFGNEECVMGVFFVILDKIEIDSGERWCHELGQY